MIHREDPLLHISLEQALPPQLEVGDGNIVFASGWAFHRRRRITDLRLRVEGQVGVAAIHGMPRSDVFRAHPDAPGRGAASYRSGFWGLVPFERNGDGDVRVELQATLSNGHLSTRTVGLVAVRSDPARDPVRVPSSTSEIAEPLIAICMTTLNPDLNLFRRQVNSIREQTHRNWVCVVSDDHSSAEAFDAIRLELDGDPHFHVSQPERRLGFYGNFERALRLVPEEAELIALSDQDDRWHANKLEVLRAHLGSSTPLAYSDMRVVAKDGSVISPTFFTARRNNHTNLSSLVIGNTVTGAASLFDRRVLALALPFPQRLGYDFHDHWLAMVALSLGKLAYVDEPLQDYVQHGANAWGEGGSTWLPRDLRGFPTRLAVSNMLQRWHRHYFHQVSPLRLHAQLLLLRGRMRIAPRKRRQLRRLAAADGSRRWALVAAWLELRSAAARLRRWPTMGNEKAMVRGILWRHLVHWQGLVRRRKRASHRQAQAAVPAPPTVPTGPETEAAPRPARRMVQPDVARLIAQKTAPLHLSIDATRQPTVNILVPTIDLVHFFGAYIGKFNLARRLAAAGTRVRIVAVEPTSLQSGWREQIRGYEGLDSIFEEVEFEHAPGGQDDLVLSVHADDRFVATTSWTAYQAHAAALELGRGRFLFVIQEYDPLVHPVGTLGACSRRAYEFPHLALFSTELLRDFFRSRGLGVFAPGPERGDHDSRVFRNAITRVEPASAPQMASMPPRLLFYARPEPHAERNLYELGLLALTEAIRRGAFGEEWEFNGIGALEPASIELTEDTKAEILPRTLQSEYALLLNEHSVGLALMDTPHPSLVPLEMASAGMLTVTSTFANKTGAALRSISSNLIPAEPTVDGVASALAQAAQGIGDFERRGRGARFDWPRSWSQAFDDQLIAEVQSMLNTT